MKCKGKLFCYPTTPPTSPKDPEAILPQSIVRAHEAMLEARGVPVDGLETCSETVRAQLLLQHWESVTMLGAHHYEPFATQLARPGRGELVAAIREMNGERMFAAYRKCVEFDGLPEIEKSWRAIVAAYGLDCDKGAGHG